MKVMQWKTVGSVTCMFLILASASSLPRKAGLSWWQRVTELSASGRLDLRTKPWWPRAAKLKNGQRFTLDLSGYGRPDAIVTRLHGDIIEAIDTTGHAAKIWNQDNTTYIVSYKGTGLVNRMVSYIDDTHSGHADEMEIRYFRDGYLRFAWFGRSYGGGNAAKIFALKHWQYAGNDHGSRFRGNEQIYINKYDPKTGNWTPLSECPFSFWGKNGRADVTLRVSATPAPSSANNDTDYANDYDYMWAPNTIPTDQIYATNMRLSFNVDARPRHDPLDRPHSNFSFTMVGRQPYHYPGMRDFDPNRIPPQTTVHMPWAMGWKAALHYPANAIGFTWDEARTNFRWEGQFWIYQREYLSNTGSPTERWNMRREYSRGAGIHPALYFSAADQRYHLLGAQQGWMEVGHIVDNHKDLEFRWWDSNGRGYLNTLEIYRRDSTMPVWVEHFHPRAKPVVLNPNAIAAVYNGTILPRAIAQDRATIAGLKALVSDPLAEKYEKAADAASAEPERARYCLDIARTLYFLKLRDKIMATEAANPYATGHVDTARFRDMHPEGKPDGEYTLGDSLAFWSLVKTLHRLDQLYADGNFSAFRATLASLHSLR